MFTTDQIISANQPIRSFGRISRRLQQQPEALLIHQKCGHFLVLVSADMFEDLVRSSFRGSPSPQQEQLQNDVVNDGFSAAVCEESSRGL